jgi:hypothetical protein
VSLTSEIDYVQFVKQDVDLAKELEKMFDVMTDLIGILSSFQLNTNMGVTISVIPNIITNLSKLKQKNIAIKEQLKKIIK